MSHKYLHVTRLLAGFFVGATFLRQASEFFQALMKTWQTESVRVLHKKGETDG